MLTFLNVTGGTYTVKVQGATGDVFGIGAYHLVVDTLNISLPLPLVSSLLAPVVDGHLNDALTAATDLGGSLGPKPDQRFDATFRGVIEDRSDVDYYKVRAPAAGSGTPLTLNALVWGIDAMPLGPRLRVFDANGKPVAFRVLANEGGLFSLDVGGVTPGAVYYLSVAARNPTGTSTTGAYFLGVDFNQVPRTTFDAVGSGNVSPSATLAGSIVVTDPSVFQFALAASAAQPGGTVTMTLTDSAGRVVFTLTSTAGQPLATTTRYLAAGRYTVQCTASGSGTNPVRFDLFMLRLSFGVGPYKTKTTSSDTTAPTNDNGYTYDSSSAAQPSGYPYYF
jgi:hypothetical protein